MNFFFLRENILTYFTFCIFLSRSSIWCSFEDRTFISMASIQSMMSLTLPVNSDHREVVSMILWLRRDAWLQSSSHCLLSKHTRWWRTFRSSGCITSANLRSLASSARRLLSEFKMSASTSWWKKVPILMIYNFQQ